jgi:thymidylate kinase
MGLRRAVLWNKPVRRILYLADLLIFLVYWGYYHRVKHSVLIMDRYFYDTLVDVAGPRSWGYLRFLAAITPEPSIAVLLDVGPEVAFARKGERSLEELRQRSWAYKRVFRWLKCPVVLAPAGVGDVAAQLERLILERLIEETR